MKALYQRVASYLRKPAGWSLLILLILAALIWGLGPNIAFNGKTMMAGPGSRLLAGTILLSPWLVWQLLDQLKQRRANGEQAASNAATLQARVALEQRYRLSRHLLAEHGVSQRQQRRHPWYLLLGPESSGKKRLFASAELSGYCTTVTAPHGPHGISPAEWHSLSHCSWLQAGGSCLPSADQEPPSPAWTALLGLLRQRRAPALNAIALMLPMDLLTTQNTLELDQLARRYRLALSTLRKALGLDLPIYLLLSKADLLPGIIELCQQLTPEQRLQPLGATLPGAPNPAQASTGALGPLLAQLNRQILCRTQQESDSLRRGRLYDLPYQLVKLEGSLRQFLNQAFDSNSYQHGSRVHGIYLTIAASEHDVLIPGSMARPPVQGAFSRRLLENPLAGRPDGVTVADELRTRQRTRQRLTIGLAAACVTLSATGWAWRYGHEAEQLQQLAELGRHVVQDAAAVQAHSRIEPLLQQLDTRYAATLIPQPASMPAGLQRLTLEQSEATLPVVEKAYADALRTFLLPLVMRQLEYRLSTDLEDRQQLIGHLRAYLMLGLPERLDSAYLEDWMHTEWTRRYPRQPAVRESLETHLSRLLASAPMPQTLDESLVASARDIMRQEPLPRLCYRLLRERSRSLPDYRLRARLGRHYRLLTSEPVDIPGFYINTGYESLIKTKGPALIHDLLADDWVLGLAEPVNRQTEQALMADVESIYFQDYTSHWNRALASLRLQPQSGASADQLAALSSGHSPLLTLLQEIRLHTRLITANDPTPSAGKLAMQQHFSHFHRLLDDDAMPAPELAGALQSIGQLQHQLAQLSDSSARGLLAYKMASARMQRQSDAIGATRDSAAQLPPPLQLWVKQLADQSWRTVLSAAAEYLNGQYRSQVYRPYRDAIADYYPFNPASKREVELGDFQRFFQQEGTIQGFTDQYLEPFLISTDAGYRLRLLDGRALPISARLLTQLNRARTIHDSFFASNPLEPGIGFRLEPYSLDASLSRASFYYGSDQLEYRHGPIIPKAFTWPASLDDSRISLTLEDLGGRRMTLHGQQGTWSLFRLLEQLILEQEEPRDALQLRANIGGMRARYLLHSQRAPNPFQPGLLAGFNLPARLQ